jgi:hypothetical protein
MRGGTVLPSSPPESNLSEVSIMKNTIELLELAGYTETQIERYTKCLRSKREGALTISDRRFYLAAQGAARKAAVALEQALKAAQTRKVSGRQPVETKLHYRWLATELEVARGMIELAPGEVSGLVIILEEYLRAMSKYQPVLDQIDTSKRHRFCEIERQLLQIAVSLGRVGILDAEEYQNQLRNVFADSWSPSWEMYYSTKCALNAIFSDAEELEFQTLVRAEMERAVREIYPSVAAAV